jgi:hypothetical protein
MNKLRRFAKLGLLVVLGTSLAGCYVVPIGWGKGHRSHGGYHHHADGGSDPSRGGEMPRGGRGDRGR